MFLQIRFRGSAVHRQSDLGFGNEPLSGGVKPRETTVKSKIVQGIATVVATLAMTLGAAVVLEAPASARPAAPSYDTAWP
jgi:hypothetical protein